MYTIWLATVFVIGAYWIALIGPSGPWWRNLRRLLWTAACAAYLVHFYVAVVFAFGGSIERVYARQGSLVATYNFAITLVWTLDVAFLTWRPLRKLRLAVHIGVHIAVAVGFLTAELLFKRGFVFWLGCMLAGVLAIGLIATLITWWRTRQAPWKTRPLDFALQYFRGSVYLAERHRRTFSSLDLFKQAKRDLWAKEVQTGYTMTYVWMANQLGHFTLGLFPILLSSWILTLWTGSATANRWGQFAPPAIAAAVIIFKEWRDYATDVRKAKGANGYFRINRGDLFLNAGTAVLYMLLGVAVGTAAVQAAEHGALWPVAVFAGAMACVFAPAGYWLRQKRCFQMADIPFVYRFASVGPYFEVTWADQVFREREAASILKGFVELKEDAPRHLIVYGGEGAGKTTLTVAMGTEHAFQRGCVRFVTFFQWLQIAALKSETPLQENRDLWSWRETNILLIDDVDAGLEHASLVRADEAIRAIEEVEKTLPGEVIARLRERRSAWVLGASADIAGWRHNLCEILAVAPEQIAVVKVEKKLAPDESTSKSEPGPRSVVRPPSDGAP